MASEIKAIAERAGVEIETVELFAKNLSNHQTSIPNWIEGVEYERLHEAWQKIKAVYPELTWAEVLDAWNHDQENEKRRADIIDRMSEITGLKFELEPEKTYGNNVFFASAEGRRNGSFGGNFKDDKFPNIRIFFEADDFSGNGFFYLYEVKSAA